MDRRRFSLTLSSLLAWAAWPTPPIPERPPRRLLLFTKSAGFEHDVVKRTSGAPSVVERALTGLGAARGFVLTATKDGGVFTPDGLRDYDAVCFFTTGDLTTRGTDGEPAMTPGGKAALLAAVASGLGFVGVHSAADTFHTPPETPDRANRYVSHAGALDPYLAMLGGEFINHGPPQAATVRVTAPRFPGAPATPELRRHGEWYSLKDFAPDLRVVMVLDTEGMEGRDYRRGPYPVTWARRHGRGRVFYTALGHFEAEWSDPVLLDLLAGALRWAFGDAEAELTPNLVDAAPRHRELPPARPWPAP
jgi:type 1 glutamine amidotransferase